MRTEPLPTPPPSTLPAVVPRTDAVRSPDRGARDGAAVRRILDIRLAAQTPEALASRQLTRLAALVADARAHSPYYRDLYRQHQVPGAICAVSDIHYLPPVTKQELMTQFDRWATDTAVTGAGVDTFMHATAPGAQLYLDRYLVCTTSGISGSPGIFLHDRAALTTYQGLVLVRAALPWAWATHPRVAPLWHGAGRVAVLMAPDGHSVDDALMGYASHHYPKLRRHHLRAFSVRRPVAELTDDLNAFQPAVLIGYATALDILAQQQLAGYLHLAPQLVVTSAEWLAPAQRQQVAVAFQCSVRDLYSAAEFPGLAFACEYGTLHVNSDWLLLEPVNESKHRYVPAEPGQPSQTVLLTNLANRIQPLIRYDLADSIIWLGESCPCGSVLPAIHLEGRRDATLYYQSRLGKLVPLLPSPSRQWLRRPLLATAFNAFRPGPAR